MQTEGRMMQPDQLADKSSQDAQTNVILDRIEQQIGPRNYQNWFLNKVKLTLFRDELTVGVASPFLLAWMQKKFRDAVSSAAKAVLGPSAQIRFEVDSQIPMKVEESSKLTSLSGGPADKLTRGRKPVQTRNEKTTAGSIVSSSRSRRFANLSDFVVGSCNELALTASRQVCESPASQVNPLFIYGRVGTGKTHVLEGIYGCFRQQFPALQVMYLTAETFANYFTQALRDRTLPSFRQRFRNVDVFLVDDIDFFDGKRVIQEEFLHTFKQLEGHGRQIVLSCECHPRLLAKTGEELVTRFLSGLVCRLESPDLETRRKIVRQKASRMNADYTDEALNYVAQRFQNNVRELEGALNCLTTYHAMTGKRIGVSIARKVLSDLERDCVRIVRLSDIEQVVCEFFGVGSKELKSARRHRSVSFPRMLAMYLSRKHTQAAYSEIGQYFGGRNHATVMSAEKSVKSWLSEGREFRIASQSWRFDDVIESLEHHLQAS